MRSPFLKSLVSVFVILVVVITLVLVILANRVRNTMVGQIAKNLRDLAMVSAPVGTELLTGSQDAARTYIEQLGKSLDVRVTLIGRDGKVVADSEHDPQIMDNHLDRPEIQQARVEGSGEARRYSQTLNTDFLYVARRLGDARSGGYIRFSMPLTAVRAFHQDAMRWIFFAGMALLLLAAVIVYVYSLYLRKPLKEIGGFTAELASGDFSARLLKPVKGDAAGIYRDLNRMAEKLEEMFAAIENDRNTMTSVLAAMVDGVCVVSRDWKIINRNESFKKMFALAGDPLNRDVGDVIRHVKFLEMIDRCKTDKSRQSAELETVDGGPIFTVNSFHIPGFDGWAFVFTDVTKTKNLERIKSDFVTNLSHELRTPLTAIKGYLETIAEPGISPADRDKFIKIVRDNTERLVNIVADLLTLSDFERAGREIQRAPFDLNELAADVIVLFADEARKKQLKLAFEPESMPAFTGDRFMIQQLLVNLVSNAIRFTEKGRVTLELRREADKFRIVVSDTGIGIPVEEIVRIFERFYTVDKARSRAHGGTGLGLAIVKHIAQAHGGEVRVESRLGTGSKFTVTLPAPHLKSGS